MCDYEKYTRVVKFQNLMMDFELSFKRNPTYIEILEHTDIFGANRYLAQINTEFGNFYNNVIRGTRSCWHDQNSATQIQGLFKGCDGFLILPGFIIWKPQYIEEISILLILLGEAFRNGN